MPSYKDISTQLETWAPTSLQESYDNAGLIVGEPETPCHGVLVSIDCTEQVVHEAIERNCNLIVSHHPIWFGPRKKLNGEDYVSRTVLSAIRNGIGLYALHTNLDNVFSGVNAKMADKLGLVDRKILVPKTQSAYSLSTLVPPSHLSEVLNALFDAGAGKMGNYRDASFQSQGLSTFTPEKNAQPFLGEIGSPFSQTEIKIEVVFPDFLKGKVLSALFNHHPYETPAYTLQKTENSVPEIGAGMIGYLPDPVSPDDLLKKVKETFRSGGIRYSKGNRETLSKVAICGGAGSFLIGAAMRAGAEAFITGDISYHKFFDNEARMLLMDIGHFESEQFTSELVHDFICKSFPNFAVLLSETNTNPVHYY